MIRVLVSVSFVYSVVLPACLAQQPAFKAINRAGTIKPGASVVRSRPIRLRAAEFRLPKPGVSLKEAVYSARNYYP